MKTAIEAWVLTAAVVLAAGSAGARGSARPHRRAPKAEIARGKYLVDFGGCGDCHTPQKFDPKLGMPVPDESRALSGQPAKGPDPAGTLGPRDQALIGPTFTSFKAPFGTVSSPFTRRT